MGEMDPLLFEALGATDLNLLLNVGFNSEDADIYWMKEAENLAGLINWMRIFIAKI